ncbi:MAG: Ig-like domain-containing protein, partial [Alphaproteobacteria bacterium]
SLNRPVEAVNDTNTTKKNNPVTGNVLGNDSYPDGLGGVRLMRSPGKGRVSLNGAGAYTYTPGTGFDGSDSFHYQLRDKDGDKDRAIVTIKVTNNKVDAVDDLGFTKPGGTTGGNVLGNDEYEDGGPKVTPGGRPSTGVATLNGGGAWSYTAPRGFTGMVSFGYTLTDVDGDSDSARVIITVKPDIPPPPTPPPPPPTPPPTSLACETAQERGGGDPGVDELRSRADATLERTYGNALQELAPADRSIQRLARAEWDMAQAMGEVGMTPFRSEGSATTTLGPGDSFLQSFARGERNMPRATGEAGRTPFRSERGSIATPAPGERSLQRMAGTGTGVIEQRDRTVEITRPEESAGTVTVPEEEIGFRQRLQDMGRRFFGGSGEDAPNRQRLARHEPIVIEEQGDPFADYRKKAGEEKIDQVKALRKYDLAYLRLADARQAQRGYVDAIVARPEEALDNLMVASRRNPEVVPVHPMLDPADVPAARRLYEAVRNPEMRKRIKDVGGRLLQLGPGKVPDDKTAAGADDLFLRLSAPQYDIPESVKELTARRRGLSLLGRGVVAPEERASARTLVARMARALPILDALQTRLAAVAASAATEGQQTRISADRADIAAAQVFMTEVIGKERLIAGREISSRRRHQTVGVGLEDGRLVREVALDSALDMVELNPIAPIDESRLAHHRQRLEAAKDMNAKAVIAQVRARWADKQELLSANKAQAARAMEYAALRTGNEAVIKAATALPVYEKAEGSLEYKGDLTGTANVRSLIKRLGDKIRASQGVLAEAAAASPELARAYGDYAIARNISGDYRKIAGRSDVTEAGVLPDMAEARTVPDDAMPGEAMPAGDARQDYADTLQAVAAIRGALPGQVMMRDLFGEFSGAAESGLFAPESAGDPRSEFIQRYDFENLNDPAGLEELISDHVEGRGNVHDFTTPDQANGDDREMAQIQTSGGGIVHSAADLQDPDYYREQFTARVGSYGWSHEFESPEALRDFAQERINGYGMVHLRSDLQDPDYYARLFQERMGGLGVVHRFDSPEQMRDFVNSRLGGLGRAYTCQDLLDQGYSMDQAQGMFDRAAAYGAKDFEARADYDERMLREHPDEFTRRPDGNIDRLSWDEMQQRRHQELLATGEWIVNPQTGVPIRIDSKAGQQVVNNVMQGGPQQIRIRLDDGRTATLTVDGFSSMRDSMEDAMVAQGYRRDGNGNWVDENGTVMISADRVDEMDGRYQQAMNERLTGFSNLLTYRPEEDRPRGPPPPLRDQMASLEEDIIDGFGYEVKNLRIGGARLDSLQVRPGETVSEALERTLAGSRMEFDGNGNIIDSETGEVAMTASDLTALDNRYRERVINSVFGEENGGINREVLWLAENGTPAQQRQAQAIMQDMRQRLSGITQVEAAQRDIQRQIDEVANDPSLGVVERRQRLRQLNRQMGEVTGTRRELEQGLIDGAQAANDSARDAVKNQLGFAEQDALRLNDQLTELSAEYLENQALLDGKDLLLYRRLELERRQRTIQEEVFKKNNQFLDVAQDIKDPRRIVSLINPVDVGAIGIDENTVANRRDAERRAYGIRRITIDRETVTVYVDEDGDILRDPQGKPFEVGTVTAQRFQGNTLNGLARRADNYVKSQERFQQAVTNMDGIKRQIDELNAREAAGESLTSAERRRLRRLTREHEEHRQTAVGLYQEIQAFDQRLGLLESYDRDRQREEAEQARERGEEPPAVAEGEERARPTIRDQVIARADAIANERKEAEQAYLEGARSITWTDEDGVEHTYRSPRQIAYQEEMAARRAEALTRAEAQAALEAAEAAEAARRQRAEQQAAVATRAREEAEQARRERAAHQSEMDRQARTERARLGGLEEQEAAARRRYEEAREFNSTASTEELAASETAYR